MTKEDSHRHVHARSGTLYTKRETTVADAAGTRKMDLNFTDVELKNNLIHETGHLLGFDERYSQNTKTTHAGYDKDIMSNISSYDNKEIFKIHFEDAAKFAFDVSFGESSHLYFRGDLDETRGGELTSASADYQATQTSERRKEVGYFKWFLLLNPF
jgi:hypothetical protein